MQLKMVFFAELCFLPEWSEPHGFVIRKLDKSDYEQWGMILHPACGFKAKDLSYVENFAENVINNGIFGAFEISTGNLAATASAQRGNHLVGNGLGWVMTHPDFRCMGLGRAVSLKAMHHLTENGVDRFELVTDDHRLAALKLYLKMGFLPCLWAEDMLERWQKIFKILDQPESRYCRQYADGNIELC